MIAARHHSGFTIVEILVTIVVTAVFLLAIAQVSIIQSRLSASYQMYNTADLLTYNNLRAYANGKAPTWFTCTYASGNPLPVTLISDNRCKPPNADRHNDPKQAQPPNSI